MGTIIITGLLLTYIHLLLHIIYNVLCSIFVVFYIIFKFCKGSLQLSVVLGAVIGDRLRAFKDKIRTGARFLIAQGRIMHEQHIPLVLLGVLALILLTFTAD